MMNILLGLFYLVCLMIGLPIYFAYDRLGELLRQLCQWIDKVLTKLSKKLDRFDKWLERNLMDELKKSLRSLRSIMQITFMLWVVNLLVSVCNFSNYLKALSLERFTVRLANKWSGRYDQWRTEKYGLHGLRKEKEGSIQGN